MPAFTTSPSPQRAHGAGSMIHGGRRCKASSTIRPSRSTPPGRIWPAPAQFQRQGPIGIRLRKANTKHEFADLELLVDDFKVSKKHVNIYEPVVSYSADRKMPLELVINSISKNHIHGYVSEPKYKTGELEAMAKPATNNSAATPASTPASGPAGSQEKPSAARERLPQPDNN